MHAYKRSVVNKYSKQHVVHWEKGLVSFSQNVALEEFEPKYLLR